MSPASPSNRRRRRLRVLLLSPAIPPPPGGVERVTDRLAGEMASRVDLLTIATTETPDERHYRARSIRRSGRPLPWIMAAMLAQTLVALLTHRPDVVHAITWRVGVVVAAMPARLRPRLVVHAHGTELLRVGRLTRILRDVTFSRADSIVSVSRFTANLVRQTTGRDSTVVPNGVDSPTASASRPRPPVGATQVLSVGRLAERKGHDRAIEACILARRRGHDLELSIVGRGADEDRLRQTIEARQLGWVRLVTQASDDALGALYDDSDIFLLLPRDLPGDVEGFGIVYLEASAHGLPVIATDVGGVSDIVRHGITGFLVSTTDEAAIVLAQLIESTDLRGRMGSAGRDLALQMSWARCAASLLDIYRSTVRSDGVVRNSWA